MHGYASLFRSSRSTRSSGRLRRVWPPSRPRACVAILLAAAVVGVIPAAMIPAAALAADEAGTQASAPAGDHYHLAREIPLPGSEFWDYLAFDIPTARLYVSHGTRVQVVDTHSFALAGAIPDTPGVHGIAIADDLGRGYVSAGAADTVVVFDLRTLRRLATIKTTGGNPDAILYDPFTHRVFTFNGRGRNMTAIDTGRNAVIGTLALDAKPEFAASDGAGRIYVNLEDRGSLAAIDPKELRVVATWPITDCEEPSGLAIDRAHRRLFSVCSNRIMAVLDADSGRELATLPIGARVDGAAFDESTALAFATGGDGTLTIVHEDSPERFTVVQKLRTQLGARTVTVDPTTHRVFSDTARFGPPGKGAPGRPPRPTIEPGSFHVLVMEP